MFENVTSQPETVTSTPSTVSTPSTSGETATPSESEINSFTPQQLKDYMKKVGVKDKSEAEPDIIPPEKKLQEEQPNAEVPKTETQEVKPEVKAEAPKAEAKQDLSQINTDEFSVKVAEKLLEKLNMPKVEAPKQPEKPKLTPEQEQEMAQTDPVGYARHMLDSYKDDVVKEIMSKLQPIVQQDLAKKTEFVTNEQRKVAVAEAAKAYPELADEKFKTGVFKEFVKKNGDILDHFERQGKNPFKEAMRLYHAENIDTLISKAKEEGRIEGEKKVQSAQKAFIERGGKPSDVSNAINFDNMSAEEMRKYLPRKA